MAQVPSQGRRPVRWWPALVIVGVAVTYLAFIWLGDAPHRQARVVPTLKAVPLTVLALLVWAMLLSRLPGRTRLVILVVVVGSLAALRSMFRVTGVTGDAVPIVEWRRSREPVFEAASEPVAGQDPASHTGDYPQFYGPQRNATLAGPSLARDWQTNPPRELWRREVGEGWSSFAVMGSAAVTQEQRGEDEAVVRYELETGRQVWVHEDQAAFVNRVGGTGPRATPTIAGGQVYSLGATGILNCLRLDTGERVWSRDVLDGHPGRVADYGMPSSPLVLRDLVVVQIARERDGLAAYHRSSGEASSPGALPI